MSDEFNFYEEKPLEAVTLAEIHALGKQLFEARKEYEEIDSKLKEQGVKVDALKKQLLSSATTAEAGLGWRRIGMPRVRRTVRIT